MPIERERKFITNIDEARLLTDGLLPHYITQHYLSPAEADRELRIRRTASNFTDPTYATTIKQGHGEYRQETEISLLAESYLPLSTLSLGIVLKNRYHLPQPGLTLDTYRSGPVRFYGILELEQVAGAGDIGLFDPQSLGLDHLTEVTGLPDFSNRSLAATIERKEPKMPATASIEQIHDLIDKIRLVSQPAIITLSGPSGSGKTTILDDFKSKYGQDCTTISTDDYYIGKTLMRTKMPAGQATNFDHPAAIDTARLARDIECLRRGESISKPLYDMKRSEPIGFAEIVTPNNIIVIEGIAANLPEIRELSDLSLVITAPVDERLRRRMERDVERKGHTAEETLDIFMNHVEPSYQAYFAPHDAEADYQIKT